MKPAGIATCIYSILVFAGGVMSYQQDGMLLFPVLAGITGSVLLISGILVYRARMPAAFVACATAMLLGLFFGYRFISSEAFLPGGLLLTSSFGVLFCLIAGLFSELQR